jgi:serine O-acetyltransferase
MSFLHIQGFRYSYFLRKTRASRESRGTLAKIAFVFYRLLLNRYRFRYGFDISYGTSIGPGLYLGHFGGVVVSSRAVIGKNVNIAQGVTIGLTNRGRKAGAPIIGDRVWIGAHALVVGSIFIGNDALIGPGAYVNFDVPERAVVIGNPGKIVSYAGTEGYVENTVEEALESARDSQVEVV